VLSTPASKSQCQIGSMTMNSWSRHAYGKQMYSLNNETKQQSSVLVEKYRFVWGECLCLPVFALCFGLELSLVTHVQPEQ
jgi:hypothetical protein